MNPFKRRICELLICCSSAVGLTAMAEAVAGTARIVTLGGSVTEIVYALEAQASLVGTDQSSLYPTHAQTLPSVGYYRRLPAEGVVSLQPSLVIASEHAGPPHVIEQIQDLGIELLQISDKPSEKSLRQRVRQIASRLNKIEQGERLVQQFDEAMRDASPPPVEPLSAMLVVMRGGKLLGAGGNTTAHVVMTKAGLKNVLSEQSSYQPITTEAASALAPDVVIVTQSTVAAFGTLQEVKAQPAIALTPAVLNNRVVVLDDLLAMGFGLRLPQAIGHIHQEVYGGDQP